MELRLQNFGVIWCICETSNVQNRRLNGDEQRSFKRPSAVMYGNSVNCNPQLCPAIQTPMHHAFVPLQQNSSMQTGLKLW